jgi:hypothetical protein
MGTKPHGDKQGNFRYEFGRLFLQVCLRMRFVDKLTNKEGPPVEAEPLPKLREIGLS